MTYNDVTRPTMTHRLADAKLIILNSEWHRKPINTFILPYPKLKLCCISNTSLAFCANEGTRVGWEPGLDPFAVTISRTIKVAASTGGQHLTMLTETPTQGRSSRWHASQMISRTPLEAVCKLAQRLTAKPQGRHFGGGWGAVPPPRKWKY